MQDEEKQWTVVDLVRWGQSYFAEKSIESPRLTMELLLGKVLGLSRVGLYLHHDRPLTKDELGQLRQAVRRRASGEPLQYILGTAAFRSRNFLVGNGVLIPRPETEQLVEIALSQVHTVIADQGNATVWDVGCGTGCIGLTIALEVPSATVVLVDVEEKALDLAQQNAAALGALNVRFELCDVMKTIPARCPNPDVIVSNPPYIPAAEIRELQVEVREWEMHSALTDGGDGYAFYRRLGELTDVLQPRAVAVECGAGQAQSIASLWEHLIAAEVSKDFQEIDRYVHGWSLFVKT